MRRKTGRNEIPCFDYPNGCPRRKPGCQDHCEEMIAARAKNEARKQLEREKREMENAIVKRIMVSTRCKVKER